MKKWFKTIELVQFIVLNLVGSLASIYDGREGPPLYWAKSQGEVAKLRCKVAKLRCEVANLRCGRPTSRDTGVLGGTLELPPIALYSTVNDSVCVTHMFLCTS